MQQTIDGNVLDSAKSTSQQSKSIKSISQNIKILVTQQKLIQMNSQTLISSVEDFLARHSLLLEKGKGLRILAKRPAYFLLENVKGLLSHDKGKTFTVIIQTLAELGYGAQWMVLNSKFFGVPQNRERVFFVGHLRGQNRPEILPLGIRNGEDKELVYAQKSEREIARIYDPKGIAPTLHLKTGGWQEPKIIIHNTITEATGNRAGNSSEFKKSVDTIFQSTGKIRRLTPTECERLQGFPPGYTEGISDTQRYKVLGNAVTVNVIREIIKKFSKE